MHLPNSSMTPAPELLISCHCGTAKQTVRLRDHSSNKPQDINLCHCAACRHNTGLMCVSYAGIERPDSIQGLREYQSTTKTISRFFCATCGSHVFWKLQSPLVDKHYVQGSDGPLAITEQKEWWAVATGVIIEEESSEGYNSEKLMKYAKHINTTGTGDGGLSPFIRNIGDLQGLKAIHDQDLPPPSTHHPAEEKFGSADRDVDINIFSHRDDDERVEGEVLKAFCHCRTVQFQITRPNATSKLPRSNYPDLMVPYHTSSPQIQNPKDNKWWLRPRPSDHSIETKTVEQGQLTRYLAGTCACRSCRLTSGFEIQTWAFIPRSNIFFRIHESQRGALASGSWRPLSQNESDEGVDIVPLDFTTLPPSILTSYESSQGVRREFCSQCGATVFWRDRWRPELIDVSIGLLDAAEGVRAESWLDWWTERVSFAEDAGNGRTGQTAERAKSLIDTLEEGLRNYHGQGRKGSWSEDPQEFGFLEREGLP
ncbi:hypothetical protein F4679DRAFT_550636 [Xylaria curta]|nr:hypothetical protein F4679DRAFT_550636 [Xylaria curta]